MLKLTLFEFFLRIIPESILSVLAIYIFSFNRIKIKPLFMSSIFFAITTYLVRMLPIHFGIHTIIMTVIYSLIIIFINKISIAKSISSVLLVAIFLSICELVNMIILNLLKIDMQLEFRDSIMKVVYTTPSLVLLGGVILLFYLIVYEQKIKRIND
ncbi:hypothetical protein CPJCM30710_00010 [Clostridium polyendosporum]|uniref:Uncharacterized protein n=1 Tax=Clostridium polyendosporum TaxID=69208 RepID=A0A919RVN1_9CLOT|nr:hypothetical protein [Clostridium polyendosporum]GIM27335.1 hypothetical protein CPJCM30710_00010 [Clostridium polyendosporum]